MKVPKDANLELEHLEIEAKWNAVQREFPITQMSKRKATLPAPLCIRAP